jgi:hypothetical protein
MGTMDTSGSISVSAALFNRSGGISKMIDHSTLACGDARFECRTALGAGEHDLDHFHVGQEIVDSPMARPVNMPIAA